MLPAPGGTRGAPAGDAPPRATCLTSSHACQQCEAPIPVPTGLRRSTVHDRLRAADETAAERVEAPERTEVEVARRDEARSMRAVLGALPSEQRRVVELAYFGGFTHEQIAEMLGTPLGTVKGRMRLALEKMRASIEPSEAVL